MNPGEAKDQCLQLFESKTSFEGTFREPWNSSKALPASDKEIWATTRKNLTQFSPCQK